MEKLKSRYPIDGVDFGAVYNRNEVTVRREMIKIMQDEQVELSAKDIADVYALTLNDFPPHYVHTGTIVLFPKLHSEEVIAQIKRNIAYVQERPKV